MLLATLVAGVGVAGAAWAVTQDDSPTTASTTTAEASVGTYEETVTSTGTFQPAETAELSFAVSGEVLTVDVAEGDVVTAGQALATVGTETLEAELTAAEATLDAARERLDSDTDAGAGDTQLAADEASVAAAESRVAQAEEALANATLRSTIAGTVASVDLVVGDEVSGSGSSGAAGGADPAASAGSGAHVTVITTDAFVVETSVGSADLGRLQPGLQAELTPSDGGDVVYGTVASIGLVASDSGSGSATFPVEIAVTGEVVGLYAGAGADVSIIVEQRADVLTVPSAAVRTVDGQTMVTLVGDDGSQIETPVEIGASFGVQTEIVSGLEAGDEVVVPRLTGLGGGGGGEDGDRLPQLPDGFEFPGGGVFPGGGGGFGGRG
ncbi:efflux RND transporter periplasmic adaptor subunit [Jiangella anatolica]|uniref:efflux RND transporter periplasmic adaptor subunit n=1 Tax=Jiangella anatolica TaxID=2670374 RepID=UPI0018F507A6|nr:biotin/lipoyl-binding protein [Jiangella anatolica]